MPMIKIKYLEHLNSNVYLKFSVNLKIGSLSGDIYEAELIMTPQSIYESIHRNDPKPLFRDTSKIKRLKKLIKRKKKNVEPDFIDLGKISESLLLKNEGKNLENSNFEIICDGENLSEGNNLIRFISGEFDLERLVLIFNEETE